jgi:serine/threonine protein kinase
VAIKVIDMKKINNDIHKNLLASEIEVLKLMKDGQNVIELYDIFNTKNNTYIITELCDGGDLSKLIAARRSFPESEAVDIMNQIITGYNHMHSHGIIHRDLKPANIFLRNSSVKIADFGFAMKQADCKKYSSYNVGSPVYMPPEALNENKYSFKSDIWALGVIFYEMLTGKTPWRAKTEKELARLLVSIPIKKLIPPSISSSSENFLMRSLAVDIN